MRDDRDLEDFFLKEKPVNLLVQLRSPGSDNYASALASSADVTYSHTVKCLKKMNSHGLVEFERRGRKKEVTLTDQGSEIAEDFYSLLEKLTDQ